MGLAVSLLRLSPGAQLAVTCVYSGLDLLLGGCAVAPEAGSWTLAGTLLALGSTTSLREMRQGLRDSLTGSFARSYALFQIERRLREGAFPFTVALADLDGFKAINDTYGHAAGDAVLSVCTKALEARLRPGDLLARYGGDEFLILWPETDGRTALAIAERLRAQIESTPFRTDESGRAIHITLSIGLVEAVPGMSTNALLSMADESLYLAKSARNRVLLGPHPGRPLGD